jgi:hypothetical protein
LHFLFFRSWGLCCCCCCCCCCRGDACKRDVVHIWRERLDLDLRALASSTTQRFEFIAARRFEFTTALDHNQKFDEDGDTHGLRAWRGWRSGRRAPTPRPRGQNPVRASGSRSGRRGTDGTGTAQMAGCWGAAPPSAAEWECGKGEKSKKKKKATEQQVSTREQQKTAEHTACAMSTISPREISVVCRPKLKRSLPPLGISSDLPS